MSTGGPKWAHIYAELRGRIRTCDLLPGASISELGLARIYKCSPTPVRDALNRLRQEGLIVGEDQRRQIVAPLTLGDVLMLGETRLVLETGCLRLYFTRKRSIADKKVVQSLRENIFSHSVRTRSETISANRMFHIALAELSKNDRLISLVSRTLDDSERIFHIGIELLSASEMQARHLNIIDAVEQDDLNGALSLIEADIYDTKDRVIKLLLERPSMLDGMALQLNKQETA